jgi:hypothetical protein
MTQNPKRGDDVAGRDPRASNLEKDPDEWVSGNETSCARSPARALAHPTRGLDDYRIFDSA